MTSEARAALCRRIAEALEPMLANTDGEWVKLIDGRSEFYSKHRLWQYGRTSHDYSTGEWIPRRFAEDGNAMLALISAMEARGLVCTMASWIDADGKKQRRAEFLPVDFDPEASDGSETCSAETLPLAVTLAAERALGVEREGAKEGA